MSKQTTPEFLFRAKAATPAAFREVHSIQRKCWLSRTRYTARREPD